jgi:hypothetical protein
MHLLESLSAESPRGDRALATVDLVTCMPWISPADLSARIVRVA